MQRCISVSWHAGPSRVSFHEKLMKLILKSSLFILALPSHPPGVRAKNQWSLKIVETIITCDTMFSLWCRVTTFPAISRQSQIIFSHTGRSSSDMYVRMYAGFVKLGKFFCDLSEDATWRDATRRLILPPSPTATPFATWWMESVSVPHQLKWTTEF